MEAKTVRFLYSQRCKEVRAQLVEQLKCLDQQCELRVQLLQDLQDFFRKKAEIEMDYSRNLEKLAERFLTKTRSTKDHLLKYVVQQSLSLQTIKYSCRLVLCTCRFVPKIASLLI
ncbi:SLIT-ROBO Rho GTPase-activating protein 2 [Goodea atripinnis]|uniref:SLIT-ROBO Rho GTPase-activating protein 2 n=1 Tax=Goodea atripinnis TaxID=208336 RepID=A0ABV0MH73_9TELE